MIEHSDIKSRSEPTAVDPGRPAGTSQDSPGLLSERASKTLFSRQALSVIITSCLAFFWSQSVRAIVYAVMPALQVESGLTAAQTGLVTSLMFSGYCLGTWLSGRLPFSRRAVVVGGILLSIGSLLAFTRSSVEPALAAAACAAGLGVGLYLPLGLSAIVGAVPVEQRARALSWHELAANAGLLVTPAYLSAVLRPLGWRLALSLWTVVGLIVGAVFWLVIPDAPAPVRRAQPASQAARWWTPLLAALPGGTIFGLIAGLPAILPVVVHRQWGIDPGEAAAFVGLIRLGAFPTVVLGGLLADRLGYVTTLLAGYGVALVGLVGATGLRYGTAFTLLVLLVTSAGAAITAAYYGLLGDIFREGERERVMSVASTLGSLTGTVLTPALLTHVFQHTAASTVFTVSTAYPVVGVLSVLALVRETRRRATKLGEG